MRRIVLALALVACGTPRPAAEGDPASPFPHPADYVHAHGADAVASEGSCLACHDLDAAEDATGAEPTACHTCHADYPHDASFAEGSTHGAAWGETCTGCHGAIGDSAPGGTQAGRCHSCHSTFPHGSGYMLRQYHGADAAARGTADACLTCHTDGDSCHACHADYPHTAGDFSDPAVHGAAYVASGSCGVSCHDGTPSQGGPVCSTCHDQVPHPDGWPTGHIEATQQRGYASCATCHADGDVQGPELPVSTCAPACHAGGAR